MGAIQKRSVTKINTPYVDQQEKAELTSMRKKKKVYRRLSAFLVIAAAMSFYIVSTLITQAAELEKQQIEKQTLKKKLSALEKDQKILEEDIVKLNDDDYIAKLARRDYFLSKKGEIIFNLPKDHDKEKSSN